MSQNNIYYTTKEAAELLNVRYHIFRQYVIKNKIAYIKIGNKILFSEESLNKIKSIQEDEINLYYSAFEVAKLLSINVNSFRKNYNAKKYPFSFKKFGRNKKFLKSEVSKYLTSKSKYTISKDINIEVNEDEYLTINDASIILKTSPQTIRKWIINKKLLAVMFSHKYIIAKKDIKAFLNDNYIQN